MSCIGWICGAKSVGNFNFSYLGGYVLAAGEGPPRLDDKRQPGESVVYNFDTNFTLFSSHKPSQNSGLPPSAVPLVRGFVGDDQCQFHFRLFI